MKQGQFVVFTATGTPLSIESAALPVPASGEMLVRNEFTTLCRSDLNTYEGKRQEKCPTILGHEIVGRIATFGEEGPLQDLRQVPLATGDRVTWGIYASDPDSAMARRGIPQKAPDLFKYGHEQLRQDSGYHGGLASHTLLRPHTPVVKLAESVPLPVAAIINCAVATVAAALRLAGCLRDQVVVVSGAGMLGLVACAMSEQAGARRVIAVDVNQQRLDLARHFGAQEWCTPEEMQQRQRSAGAVVELSGANSAMHSSLDWLQIGGTAVWVGGTYPQPPLAIDAESVIRNLLSIRGLHNYNAEDLLTAVTFIEQHHQTYPFLDLVHEMHGLASVEDAFTYALDHNPPRVGIRLT